MTTSPRLRRLAADQQAITTAFAGHPHIEVTPMGPAPAERYRIVYRVPALRLAEGNELRRINLVVVDLVLPSDYPRDKPYCTTEAPIFHPNFGNYICIADFWSPSNTIQDVIVQIGDMLQYKTFNTRSPLNAIAARWAAENVNLLPVGTYELLPIDPEIRLGRIIAESDLGPTPVPVRAEADVVPNPPNFYGER